MHTHDACTRMHFFLRIFYLHIFVKCLQPTSKDFFKKKRKPIQKKQNPIETSIRKKQKNSKTQSKPQLEKSKKKKQNPIQTSIRKKQKKAKPKAKKSKLFVFTFFSVFFRFVFVFFCFVFVSFFRFFSRLCFRIFLFFLSQVTWWPGPSNM